jgi:serine/threonine protein kinase
MDDRDLAPGSSVGHYCLVRRLDANSIFRVWLAEHVPTGLPVAIKCMPRSLVTSDDSTTRFTREVSLVRLMDHPFIVKLFDLIEDPSRFFLVFEFVERGSLAEFISASGAMPEPQARRCFAEIICALNYLHNVSCVPHRDLQPRHVLFDGHGHIRLADFGFSQIFTANAPLSPFSPPEVLAGERYTPMSDVWNAGVLLLAMIAGELPRGQLTVADLRQHAQRPPIPRTMSPLATNLVELLLQESPEERPTLAEIMEHPWLQALNFACFFIEPIAVIEAQEIADRLRAFGYEIELEVLKSDHELKDICQIIERRILGERVHATVYEASTKSAQKIARGNSTMTAPLSGRMSPSRQVHMPVVHPHLEHGHRRGSGRSQVRAVTVSPVCQGLIHRRLHT